MSKTPTRIYNVSSAGNLPHLVRASSAAQAVRHVAQTIYQVRVATQDDIVGALETGVEVEDASAATTDSEAA